MRAVAARFVEADRQVLAHPIDGETEVELAGDHRLVAVVHLPRLRRALGDDLDRALGVEAGALGEMQPLGESLDQAGDANLVDHLGELPRADRPHQFARAGIGRAQGFDLGEGRFVAAAHHRQRAVLGAGLAAGNRRVDEAESAFFRFPRQFASDIG
jgi:hypothetical protein